MLYFSRITALVVLLYSVLNSTVSAQTTDTTTLATPTSAPASIVNDSTSSASIDTAAAVQPPTNTASTAPSIGKSYSSYVATAPMRSTYIDEYSSKVASIRSSIPLEYNSKVRALINVYTVQRRNVSERILAYSSVYFPIFEHVFSQYGIPTELKYLAISESALNTHAVSRSGAIGLWQFMGPTAKDFHLTINDQVDERRDPYKATHAAARYLKKLYNRYGDWLLAMAAYNCGPGALDNAIKRSGGIRDFWLLHDYLPQETRSYVPSYIGATYLMHYYFDHYLRPVELEFPNAYAGSDTVLVLGPIHFAAITQYINVKEAELRFLNPSYKQDAVPQSHFLMSLRLPVTEITSFRQKLPQIYAYSKILNSAANGDEIADTYPTGDDDYSEMSGSADADRLADGYEFKTIKKKTTVKTNKTQYYIVKKGDVLSKIADKFNCNISDLKRWNRIKGSKIERGDKLKIVKSASTTKYVPVRVAVPVSDFNDNHHTNSPSIDKDTDDSPNLLGMSLYDADDDHKPSTSSSINPTANKPKPYKETVSKTYIVKKGDNLVDIAKKLNCDVAELKRWNKLKSSRIDVKDKLKYQTEVWVTPKETPAPVVTNHTPSTVGQQASSVHSKPSAKKVDIDDIERLGGINLYDNNIVIGDDDAEIVSQQLSLYGDLETDDADFVKVSTKFYTVKKGDALSEIAAKHNCDVSDIKRWNKLTSNVITPGQQLKMSPDVHGMADDETLEKAASATDDLAENVAASSKKAPHTVEIDDQPITFDLSAEEPTAAAPEKTATKTIVETVTETYTVRKGDALSEIAEKNKCSISDLKAWNKIKGSKIEVGDKLKIVRKVKKTVPVHNTPANTSTTSTPKPFVVDIDDLEAMGGINLYDNNVVIADSITNEPVKENIPTTVTPKPAEKSHASVANDHISTYKVKKGDTLWDIVQKYPANTIESLCRLNGLTKKTALKPGVTVKVKTK